MTIRTSCGAFEIGRSGRARKIAGNPSPVPQGAGWWPYTGIWDKVENAHLVVGRWQQTLWRSTGRFPAAYQVGALTVGPRALAFSYGWRPEHLFLAPLNGSERRIAGGEVPLGWTSSGLYTRRNIGGELLLRRSDGSLRATIARQIYTYSYDRGDGSLYFLARGTLVRAHGATERQLATLSSLGLTPRGSLQLEPLGGLIALQNAHRLVVLRPNGSLFTAVPLPPRKASGDGVSSTPTAAPDRSAIAFTATRGHGPGGGSPGTEAVYLVRAGAARGRAIHSERVDFAVCERGSTLAWHGRWLLYSTSEGNLSLVDTSRPHHAIDLAQTLRRLPGTSGDQGHLDFTAYWTGDPSGL